MNRAPRLLSRPRHPVTGKRIIIRAHTQRELNAYLHRLDVIRQEMRLSIATAGDVQLSLRGLERKRVTLLEAADSYASLTRLAPKTRAATRNMVRDAGAVLRGRPVKGALEELAGERLEALTAPRVAKHFRALADRLAWETVITTWRKLRAIIRHAAEQGWITAAPWGMWRPARPTHPRKGRERRECCRNAGERDALLAAAAGQSARFVAALALALHTGARTGELAGLKWRDVRLTHDAATVRIERQYDRAAAKEEGARSVDVPRDVADALHMYTPNGLPPSGAPVFPARSGGHMKQGNVIDTKTLRLVAARAGLGDPKRWSPHSLRDSFITIEAQACGGDLRRLAERSGHRSIDSLVRYLQTFSREPRPLPALPARASA